MDAHTKIYIAAAILLVLFCVVLPLYMRRQSSHDEGAAATGAGTPAPAPKRPRGAVAKR